MDICICNCNPSIAFPRLAVAFCSLTNQKKPRHKTDLSCCHTERVVDDPTSFRSLSLSYHTTIPLTLAMSDEPKLVKKYVPPHRRRGQAAPAETKSSPKKKNHYCRRTAPQRPHTPWWTPPTTTSQTIDDAPTVAAIFVINLDRRTDKFASVQEEAKRVGLLALQRWSAVDGAAKHGDEDIDDAKDLPYHPLVVSWDWDATKNAMYDTKVMPGWRTLTPGEWGCAMSHVQLWQRLVEGLVVPPDYNGDNQYHCDGNARHNHHHSSTATHLLILEDDVALERHLPRQARAVWDCLPADWGILYWGFNSRGPRRYIVGGEDGDDSEKIALYQPTYGFHTHAYWITRDAATVLLQHLPVVGPLDVWLADNKWFDIPTYCAIRPGRGWFDKGTEQYEGVPLVRQKKRELSSDIVQSAIIYS